MEERPSERRGVAGMLLAFREVMEGPGGRVLFLGSEGTFAAPRPRLQGAGDSSYFCPGRTVELRWRRGYGFQTGRRVRPERWMRW